MTKCFWYDFNEKFHDKYEPKWNELKWTTIKNGIAPLKFCSPIEMRDLSNNHRDFRTERIAIWSATELGFDAKQNGPIVAGLVGLSRWTYIHDELNFRALLLQVIHYCSWNQLLMIPMSWLSRFFRCRWHHQRVGGSFSTWGGTTKKYSGGIKTKMFGGFPFQSRADFPNHPFIDGIL